MSANSDEAIKMQVIVLETFRLFLALKQSLTIHPTPQYILTYIFNLKSILLKFYRPIQPQNV